MFWFVLRFAIWSMLLFGLIYFQDFSPLYIINKMQTEATVFVTQSWVEYCHIAVRVDNETVIFDHGLQLLILDACNGMAPFLLYLAAMLAYPTRYSIKTVWFLGGMAFLFTLNMLRIMLITLAVIAYPESFEWAHDIVGRYGMGIATLLVFYFFTTRVSVCVPYGIIMNGKYCHDKAALRR